jgi:diadenylate cyclase
LNQKDRLFHLHNELWEVVVELCVIWIAVYIILSFLRGTRGARVIKGMALLLIVTLVLQIVSGQELLERLSILSSNILALASIIFVVVFAPELRRALVRLGEVGFGRSTGVRKQLVIEELLGALQYLSRNKIGALIAIERQVGLRGIVEIGTPLNADVTKELIETIFWPGSALHDMGVVIRGDRVVAAGVQFPLAEGEGVPQELGSRHRAAIGLSQEADALVIAVSEETGTISVAERGELQRGMEIEQLRSLLSKGLPQMSLGGDNGDDSRGDLGGKTPLTE